MSPIRKIRKQLDAKKTIAGSVVICLMIVIALFSSSIVFLPRNVKAAGENWWNSNWDYRMLVTINQTFIDADLINFPVLVNITDNTTMYEKVNYTGIGGEDIAFIDYYDNTTQFNHEIEFFLHGGGTLTTYIWVNVTYVYSDKDTNFWMYYGNPAAAAQWNPEGTWDDNFLGVWHMADNTTSDTLDSTQYDHDGAKQSATHPATSASGMVANCQDFDGLQDHINITTPADFNQTKGSIELWLKGDNGYGAAYYVPFSYQDKDSNTDYHTHFLGDVTTHWPNESIYFNIEINDISETQAAFTNGHSFFFNTTWYYYAFTVTTGANKFYLDGIQVTGGKFDYKTGSAASDEFTHLNNPDLLMFGARKYNGAAVSSFYPGLIDEARFSKIARNESWIKATYSTISISFMFLSFGAEEMEAGATSTYTLNGLEGAFSNFTWVGNAGDTIWSNATSGPGGTGEINLSIVLGDSIEYIDLWIDDLDVSINASNITAYISRNNNSAWYGVLGTFSDGGSNLTLNQSTWVAGMGNNPFDMDGPVNRSVYIRLKLTVPASVTANTYFQSDWVVYIGHYT